MRRASLEQSVGYLSLFSTLGAGAIITWVLWRLSEQPMGYLGDNAELEPVRRSVQWNEVLLNNFPVIVLIFAVAGSIAFTVYQTRFA